MTSATTTAATAAVETNTACATTTAAATCAVAAHQAIGTIGRHKKPYAGKHTPTSAACATMSAFPALATAAVAYPALANLITYATTHATAGLAVLWQKAASAITALASVRRGNAALSTCASIVSTAVAAVRRGVLAICAFTSSYTTSAIASDDRIPT